jgi:signal transduction histidine kinase
VVGIDTSQRVLGIVLHQDIMAYRLFVNAHEVLAEGTISTDPLGHVPAASHRMECFVVDSPAADIVIHMASLPRPTMGLGMPQLGSPHELRRRRKASVGFAFLIIGAIIVMGLYHGVVVFVLKREIAALYLFLFCVSFAISLSSSFFENLWPIFWPQSSYWVYFRTGWLFGLTGTLCLILLAGTQYPDEFPRKVVVGIGVLVALLSIPTACPNRVFVNGTYTHLLNTATSIIAMYAILALATAVLRRRRDAVLFLVGYGTLGTSHITDSAIISLGIPTTQHLALGSLVLVITQTVAIARRATRIQRETLERREQLAHAEKLVAMGTLVSTVAHEISSPTNVIRLSSVTMERAWESIARLLDGYVRENGDFAVSGMAYGELKHEIPEAIRRTTRNSDRIKRIIDDLRRFALKDTEPLSEGVKVNEVVKEAAGMLEHTLCESTANLRVRLRDDIPPVRGNVQRLEQVVVNLLNNSCQALSSPSEGIHISTGYVASRGVVEIVVRDEGRGMDRETLQLAKRPFFTTKAVSGGTGLGLSICRHIVEQHGGTIEICSREGEGTEVRICLPAA